MLIITAPGQGAQTPGFLAPWLELPGVAERLGAASELAGCDLIRFGTTASADEIRDTAVAQPLLVAAALVAAAACRAVTRVTCPPTRPPGTASESWPPGSSPACSDADDAMRLVRVRGDGHGGGIGGRADRDDGRARRRRRTRCSRPSPATA